MVTKTVMIMMYINIKGKRYYKQQRELTKANMVSLKRKETDEPLGKLIKKNQERHT